MKTKLIPFDIEKAKAGAKVVTRDGHKVDTIRFDEGDSYPISGWIRASQLIGDSDEYASFTKEGYYISSNNEDCRDLFIEVEETDDYNPYKATVKSIADMVKRYADSDSDLQDFYNEVKAKCREALKQINKEVKTILMTHQEVSDWLCQCPEEYREFKYKEGSVIMKFYDYCENETNTPANDVLIRKNHGEWQEPLIEE